MSAVPKPLWTVPCTLVRVIDGDTVIVRADLGWRVEIETAVRIDGINAPEHGTPEGDAATAFLAETLLADGRGAMVSKRMLGAFEKYGRVLADLTFPDAKGAMVDVAQTMLASGHAKPWHGRGPKPV